VKHRIELARGALFETLDTNCDDYVSPFRIVRDAGIKIRREDIAKAANESVDWANRICIESRIRVHDIPELSPSGETVGAGYLYTATRPPRSVLISGRNALVLPKEKLSRFAKKEFKNDPQTLGQLVLIISGQWKTDKSIHWELYELESLVMEAAMRDGEQCERFAGPTTTQTITTTRNDVVVQQRDVEVPRDLADVFIRMFNKHRRAGSTVTKSLDKLFRAAPCNGTEMANLREYIRAYAAANSL